MILVATSVWIDHLRQNDEELARRLNDGEVMIHPFVIGELALGNLRNRAEVLTALRGLPQSLVATHEEALLFIEENALSGMRIGCVDAHLLAAVRLSPPALRWTRDKRLLSASTHLGLLPWGDC